MLPWPVDSLGFLEQVCAYMFNFYTCMVVNALLHKSIPVICIDRHLCFEESSVYRLTESCTLSDGLYMTSYTMTSRLTIQHKLCMYVGLKKLIHNHTVWSY